jgi:hypothetical protein
MSESTFTPGPWALFQNAHGDQLIRCASEGPLKNCVVGSVAANPPQSHYEGNARLLAAAPQMLSALKRIKSIIDESEGVFGFHLNGDLSYWFEHQEDIDELSEALALATGEEEPE